MEELHLNNLFPKIHDDTVKMKALDSVVQILKEFQIEFVISCAIAPKKKLTRNYTMRAGLVPPEVYIIDLSFYNIPYFITEITKREPIQFIVDAGFDQSFKKKLHRIYMSIKNGVDGSFLFSQSWDKCSTPNYKNILPPVFVDSQDERLIQIADLIVGVQMWKIQNKSSDFSKQIIEIVNKLDSQIKFYPVEWNIKDEVFGSHE